MPTRSSDPVPDVRRSTRIPHVRAMIDHLTRLHSEAAHANLDHRPHDSTDTASSPAAPDPVLAAYHDIPMALVLGGK